MSDRATVIGNVAAGLRRGQVSAGPDVPAPHGSEIASETARLTRHLGQTPVSDPGGTGGTVPWPRDLLVERFAAELTAIAGRVHRVPGARAAIAAVLAVCREHAASRVLAWAQHSIEAPGLHDALAADGVTVDDGWLPAGDARAARLGALEPIRIGVTGALAGIAASGTFVVISGPGRPRLASLLPPVHVAVLRADRLYPTLSSFLTAHPDIADEGANLVLITGPSRTADIEMTLTRGVHGPGEVHVVLIDAGIG